MELSEITEPLGTPDAFWSAADPAFTRVRGQTHRTPDRRLNQRIAHLRANLNYNLITHRRLVVEDVGLLMSREFSHLLSPDTDHPEYRDFLTEGIIVPAFRASVGSFSALADTMLRHNQYRDVGTELMLQFANDLDAMRPQIATTATDANRQLMHSLVENRFLDPAIWSDVGLGEASAMLVKSVPTATLQNGSQFYRRTEFWEFADKLDNKKQYALAQKVRLQISTLSLGVVATNLNLHSIYPAPYGEYVDRVFGTTMPWDMQSGNAVISDDSILASDVASAQRDVRLLASYLRPEDIWDIRNSKEYERFLAKLTKADTDDNAPAEATGLLLEAMQEYHGFVQVIAGGRLQDRLEEWRRLETYSRWIKRGHGIAAASGLISNVATTYAALPPTEGLILSSIPVGMMNVCLFLLGKHVQRDRKKFDLEARSALGEVTRPSGSLAVELYGPADFSNWANSNEAPDQ